MSSEKIWDSDSGSFQEDPGNCRVLGPSPLPRDSGSLPDPTGPYQSGEDLCNYHVPESQGSVSPVSSQRREQDNWAEVESDLSWQAANDQQKALKMLHKELCSLPIVDAIDKLAVYRVSFNGRKNNVHAALKHFLKVQPVRFINPDYPHSEETLQLWREKKHPSVETIHYLAPQSVTKSMGLQMMKNAILLAGQHQHSMQKKWSHHVLVVGEAQAKLVEETFRNIHWMKEADAVTLIS